MNQGWVCPRCQKVNAPTQPSCDCRATAVGSVYGWQTPSTTQYKDGRLQLENDRLRAALKEIVGARDWCGTEHDTDIYWRFSAMAREALEE